MVGLFVSEQCCCKQHLPCLVRPMRDSCLGLRAQHRLLPATKITKEAMSCSSAQLASCEQSSHLPALPEVSRAPGQGPHAERLAAAGAKDR